MKFRPSLNSLTTRIILLGMIMLIAGAVGRIFLLSDYLNKDVIQLTSSQLSALANYVAKDIDQDILKRRTFLERVSATLPITLLHSKAQLQAWLGERHELNPLFSLGMFVLDPRGIVLADYPPLAERTGQSYKDRDYFQQAIKGNFTIGLPVLGRATKVPILPMAIPLRDKSGQVKAVLVGISALQSPNFLESLHSTHIGATGGLLLISPQDKLFVGSSDASMILKPTPNLGVNKLHDQAMNGFRGAGITINARNIEEFAAFASVPSSGWFVVARLPTSEALAPVKRLHHFIINNSAIMLCVFFFIMLFTMRYLLAPLMNAAKHADRMTLGEIPFEPLPVIRNDEVGHLTTAYNRVLSKLLASHAELEHIATHDMLTGLTNRQLLADRMEQALARAKRNKTRVVLLYLDLDGFKLINDQSGHEAGDIALREVADRLSGVMRKEDTLARVGGDEFVILLADLNEEAKKTAELVAKKCLSVFQEPFIVNGLACKLGVSIGIATCDSDCPPKKLLIDSDQAMYMAKENGRGQFRWANE